jgi:RNA polymerase sigma-70 factor (ECF subfamily)
MNEVEKNLIRRLATGNKADFEIVYEEYFITLTRVAFRITGNEDDARDIIQNLFQGLWLNRVSFERVNTDLEAWLKTSVKNASLRHLIKSKRARQNNEVYMQQLDTFAFIDMEEDCNSPTLDEAINQLPPRQREIFTLRKVKKMSHAEIAKKLNISEKTGRNIMVQAYRKLKQILKSNGKLSLWEILLWITLNIMEL